MYKDKLSINLLPVAYRGSEYKDPRFRKVQIICVLIVLLLAFVSSVVVALRVFQSQRISTAEKDLQQVTDRVNRLKAKEEQMFLLKNTISKMSSIMSGIPSKQRNIYNLIYQLQPSSVSITSISLNARGEVAVNVVSDQGLALDEFITYLSSKERNENKITKVNIDSFSKSKDGSYKAILTVIPK